MAMRTFTSSKFKWKAKKATAFLPDLNILGYPTFGFYIKSEKTGRTMLFLPNNTTAENLDGEAYDYFSPGQEVTVRIYAEV